MQPPGFSAFASELDDLRQQVAYLKTAVRVLINDKREQLGMPANFDWETD